MKYTKELALLAAALVILAMPVDAARGGGARGGGMGGRGGSPSISRPAGNPGSQKIDMSGISREKRAPSQGQNGSASGAAGGENRTGAAAGQGSAAPGSAAPAPANTRSGFFGGGGFFNGFSLWPWMWFAGHSASSADGGESSSPQEESFGEMLARWEQNVDDFFHSIFRWLGIDQW